jgi:hypothetical protein
MLFDPKTPPPGWTAASGLLERDQTVAGCLARLEEVRGTCAMRDCRRRCHVDLERLVRTGFAALPIAQAQRFLKCQRLDSCGLAFHVAGRAGLPLDALLGRAHVRVRICCGGCGFYRVTTPEALIRKIGGADAGAVDVDDIPRQVKGPCKHCGKTVWRAQVLWPDPDAWGYRAANRR